ncbi:MAG: hypothetical protein IKD66_12135 [Solobacterium sp.]|nr:hypothetical protein [Solobacterium sp.]
MMKQKIRSRMILFLLSALLFIGCGKKAEESKPSGTYRLTGMERQGLSSEEGKETLSYLRALGEEVALVLEDDGSGTLTVSADGEEKQKDDVTWDQKSLHLPEGDYAWNREEGTLTLSGKDGSVLVFTVN